MKHEAKGQARSADSSDDVAGQTWNTKPKARHRAQTLRTTWLAKHLAQALAMWLVKHWMWLVEHWHWDVAGGWSSTGHIFFF